MKKNPIIGNKKKTLKLFSYICEVADLHILFAIKFCFVETVIVWDDQQQKK